MLKRLLNLAIVALPLVSLAATATYSTAGSSARDTAKYTPSSGSAYSQAQTFQLHHPTLGYDGFYMYNTAGKDIAATYPDVQLDSIKVYWGESTHNNCDIGKKDVDVQPDAYLVVTTTDGTIVGISSVNSEKWSEAGNSTFSFADTVLESETTYVYYFKTSVEGLAVGGTLTSGNNARIIGNWHFSSVSPRSDTLNHIGRSTDTLNTYSIRSEFVVSPAPRWIDETVDTTGTTGAWTDGEGQSVTPAWDESGKFNIAGENTFTPNSASTGDVVTVTMTTCFEGVRDDLDDTSDIPDTVQAAMRLGTVGDETSFMVFTTGKTWLPVSAVGVNPDEAADYTLRFTFDYTNGTYGVEVLNAGAYVPFANAGTTQFQLAVVTNQLSKINFQGTGSVTSILGDQSSAEEPGVKEFGAGDELALAGGAKSDALTAAQAAWLNAFNDYDGAAAWVATLTKDEFDGAYLLNFNKGGSPEWAFSVTDIAATGGVVSVTVALNRTGTAGTDYTQAINGELQLYGAESITNGAEFVQKAATVGDSDFSEGDTTTLIFTKDNKTFFYKPTIVAPAAP